MNDTTYIGTNQGLCLSHWIHDGYLGPNTRSRSPKILQETNNEKLDAFIFDQADVEPWDDDDSTTREQVSYILIFNDI